MCERERENDRDGEGKIEFDRFRGTRWARERKGETGWREKQREREHVERGHRERERKTDRQKQSELMYEKANSINVREINTRKKLYRKVDEEIKVV